MKFKTTLLITLFVFTFTFSQSVKVRFDYKTAAKSGTLNYFQIVDKKLEEIKNYDSNSLSDIKAKKHFYRWINFWKDRVDEEGNFPSANLGFYNAGVLDKNGKVAKTNTTLLKSSNQNWVNVGPQGLPEPNGYSNPPQMGRLNCLLRIKHPSDRAQDVLFVGAPNGGIWKSTDGGANWSPKLDMVAGIGVTDIKTTPDATFANYTTKPIYVSTGDYDGNNVSSIGVLKSTDGGETFNSTGLSFNESQGILLGQLIVSDDNTVHVGTSDEIKVTTDGGVTWTDSFVANLTGNFFGRVAVSGNAAMYTSSYDVIFASDYKNNNWTTVHTSSATNPEKRAVTVGEDGSFYIQLNNGQIQKFNTANNTFSNFGTIPTGYDSQGGFNQTLIVKNDMIISGEVNGSSSTDNGNTWYNSLNGYWNNNTSDGVYVHSDHHMMGKLDGAYEFWSVNDGGLNYIDYGNNPGTQVPTETYMSSKVIVTQSYAVAINPSANDDAYLIANQDNDSFSKRNGTWFSVAMGDGIQAAINYNNSDIRYTANQSGSLAMSDSGFQGQLSGIKSVNIPGVYFSFPLEINKTNPDILYAGGDDVYKIENGVNLSATSLNSGAGVANQNSSIRDIATHGNTILVAGTNGLRASLDGGVNWSVINSPNGTVNSVDFDATNNSVFYVTVSGYTNGAKVFKTVDGGANFTNISGDLPNIVMKEVLLKQGQNSEYLFVATELGVYYTDNGGTKWKRLGNGLPNVDVRDIEIHYTNDKLVAATFGRGLWEINIANSTLSNNDVIEQDKKLSIYPNPTIQNELNINLKNDNYQYLIYNVVGGIVGQGTVPKNNKIDVSTLAKNVYIIRVFNQKESHKTKFIKQ